MTGINLQRYTGGITNSIPNGEISLPAFLFNTEQGWNQTELFAKIRAARTKAEKNNLKARLPYFTPAVWVQGARKKENILKFTGLAQIDLDHAEQGAKLLRDVIFDDCTCIVAAFISPSGTGVKLLLKIPIVRTIEDYKAYHAGFLRYYLEPKGHADFYDTAAQNAVLPMYGSFDRDIKYRANFDTWTLKYEPEREIQPVETKRLNPITYNGNYLQKIESRILSIVAPHHVDLRSYCFWLGGQFMSDSYQRLINAPTESDIKQTIIYAVKSHPYMGTVQTESRIKTALDSFDAGKLRPLRK